jgi:peptidyl-prolyl cis-trans isomerase-like 4
MATWRRKDNEDVEQLYARNFEPAHFERKPISVLIEDVPEKGEEASQEDDHDGTTPALRLFEKEQDQDFLEDELSYSDVGAERIDESEASEFMRRQLEKKRTEDRNSISEAERSQFISDGVEDGDGISDEEEIRNDEKKEQERRKKEEETRGKKEATEGRGKKKQTLNTKTAKRADMKRKRDAKRTDPEIKEIKKSILGEIVRIHLLSEKAIAVLMTHTPMYLAKV